MMIQQLCVFTLLLLGTNAIKNTSLQARSSLSEEKLKYPTIKWPMVNKLIQQAVDNLLKPHLLSLYKLSREISLSSSCQSSLLETVLGLRSTKEWAIHMVDASGKIPSGILDGTVMDFGSYEECLKIRVNSSSGKESFRGRYCMIGFTSPLTQPFKPDTPEGKAYVENYGYPPEWIAKSVIRAGNFLSRTAFWFGTCVPSSCTEVDLHKILSHVMEPLGAKVKIADCQIDEPKKWPVYTIVAVCVLGIIVSFCVLGTLVDVVIRLINLPSYATNRLLCRLLKSFSFLTNTEKLFSNIPDGGPLGCFHGIRFFSATWIILGHTYFFTDTWKYIKYRSLLELQDIFNHHWPLAVIENFTIPVGSFFFMSGFLLVFSTWKKLEKSNGRLNLFMFFIHKYWRMTPALGLMIMMLMAMPLINSGPLWESTLDPPIQACQKHWWTNMLYINNWWSSEDFCIIHTWYLAALMQFHIVGVIVLLASFRWPIFGAFLGVAITLGSCIFTSLVAVWNNYPMPAPAFIKDMDIVDDYNTKIYIRTFNHTSSYFIGMLTAHLVLKYKDKRLPVWFQGIGWILAVSSSLSTIYGLYGPADSVIVRAFYIGFHRIGWAFGVAWLSYACITGNGGIINRFLSWKAFVPLGHLSYLVYLIHPLVILYRTASLRERVYYGNTELVFEYLAYTAVSFFLAFIGYVMVEKPFTVLEGIIFRSNTPVSLTQTSDAKDIPAVTTYGIKNITP